MSDFPPSKRYPPAAPLTPVVKQYGSPYSLPHYHPRSHHQDAAHIAALMSSKNPFPPHFPSLAPPPSPPPPPALFTAIVRSKWCRLILVLVLLTQIALAISWIAFRPPSRVDLASHHPPPPAQVVPIIATTVIKIVEPAPNVQTTTTTPPVAPNPSPDMWPVVSADRPRLPSPPPPPPPPAPEHQQQQSPSTPATPAAVPSVKEPVVPSERLWPLTNPLPFSEFNFSFPSPPVRPMKGLRMANLPETSPHFGYMLQDGPLMLKRTMERPRSEHTIVFDSSLRGEFLHLAKYHDDVLAGKDEGVGYCPTMPECQFQISDDYERMADGADALVTDKITGILVHNASLHFTKIGVVPHPDKALEEYEWYGTDAHASHLPMLSRNQAYSRPIHIPLYSIAETQADFTKSVNFSAKLPVILFVIPPQASCEVEPGRREAIIDVARQLRRESAMPIKFIAPNWHPEKVRRGASPRKGTENVKAQGNVVGAGLIDADLSSRDPILGNCDMMTEIFKDRPHEQPVRQIPNLVSFSQRSSAYSPRALATALQQLDSLCPPPEPLDPGSERPSYDPFSYDRYTRCLLLHSLAIAVAEPVAEPRLVSDWVFKAQSAGTQTFHLAAKFFDNNEYELSTLFPGGSALSIDVNLVRYRRTAGDTILRHIGTILKKGSDYVRDRFVLKASYQDPDRAPQFPTQLMTFMSTGSKLSFPCRVCAHVKIKKSNVQCALSVVKHVVDQGMERRKRTERERPEPADLTSPPVQSPRGVDKGGQVPSHLMGPAPFPWVPPSRLANESWGPVSTAEFLHPSERVYGLAPEFAGVIDQIYVMHYSRAARRRSHIAKVMHRLSSEAQLIMDLDREDLFSRCRAVHRLVGEPCDEYGPSQSLQERRATASSASSWRDVTRLQECDGVNYGLIVEDDAEIEVGVSASSFGATLGHLSPNYAITYVGTCSKSNKARLGQERKVEVTLGARCTGAYTISKQGVILMFKNFPLRVAIDLQMIDVTLWGKTPYGITRHPDYRNFFITPALLRPSETVNEVDETGIRTGA
ncbi:hypothetical protein DFJ73DRAFT_908476 [Zopfochytrium polystomum]|nr:hypothetical protein DFJ73DRAFT_908476 [Zopfochytrium polystomum]